MIECENTIFIRAPLELIFNTTADIESWPKILPHYRCIKVMDRDQDSMTVSVAVQHGRFPIKWISRFESDPEIHELRFQHLKAFAKGMKVRWTFKPAENGFVRVSVSHALVYRSGLGEWFARRILGDMLLAPIAYQTLRHLKGYIESIYLEEAA